MTGPQVVCEGPQAAKWGGIIGPNPNQLPEFAVACDPRTGRLHYLPPFAHHIVKLLEARGVTWLLKRRWTKPLDEFFLE